MPTFHKKNYVFIAIVLAVVLGAQASAQSEGPRFALVIGNGAYKGGLLQLKNPTNDARDVAADFERFGYQVELLVDVDEASMEAAAACSLPRYFPIPSRVYFV